MPPGEGPASISEFAGPPEARRGQDLFFDSTRTPRCAGCHALGGRGAAIGPDLLTGSARETRDFIATVQNPQTCAGAKLIDEILFQL
jgi:mono/diheme cytochrome c family protein